MQFFHRVFFFFSSFVSFKLLSSNVNFSREEKKTVQRVFGVPILVDFQWGAGEESVDKLH